MTTSRKQYKLVLPPDLDAWIERAVEKTLRSKSAEIIFILREKMENEKSGTTA